MSGDEIVKGLPNKRIDAAGIPEQNGPTFEFDFIDRTEYFRDRLPNDRISRRQGMSGADAFAAPGKFYFVALYQRDSQYF